MKEEIRLGLLCHNAEPEWGTLLQVRPFSISPFSPTLLLWVLKLQWTGFAKLLEAPLSQKVQKGELLWERGVNYPVPSHPLPGSGEGDNRRGCALALFHRMPHGIALFGTAGGTLSSRGSSVFRVIRAIVDELLPQKPPSRCPGWRWCPQQRTDKHKD